MYLDDNRNMDKHYNIKQKTDKSHNGFDDTCTL